MILFNNIPYKKEIINENTNSIYSEDYMLNEEYFGKNSNFKKIDECFDRILKLSKENTNTGITRYSSSYEKTFYKESNKLLLEIGNYLEDEFNLKSASVLIINVAAPNALSITTMNRIDKMKNISQGTVVTKQGIKFKQKDYGANIILMRELFDIDGLEGKHLTSILLHEMGHQFYFQDTIRYKLDAARYIDTVIDVALIDKDKLQYLSGYLAGDLLSKAILTNKTLTNISINGKANLKIDDGSVKKIIGSFMNIKNSIDTVNIYYKLFNDILHLTKIPIRSLSTMIKKSVSILFGDSRYNEEQFCDNFVTSYGYGTEFIKAMAYISSDLNTNFGKVIQKNLGLATIYNSLNDLDFMIFGSSECHPVTISRILDQIKYIEMQLESQKNHPMYNQMKNDLELMKKQYEEVLVKISKFEKESDAVTRGKLFAAIGNSLRAMTKGGIEYNIRSKAYDDKGNLKALKR